MSSVNAWAAINGSTVSLAVTTASARVALADTIDFTNCQVKVTTDVKVYIEFGDGTVTATVADDPIGIGQQIVSAPIGATHVAVITASGSGTGEFTLGKGI